MAEVKLEQTLSWEPHIKEEPECAFSIKEEPQEFPFHVIAVKTEEDEDKASVLHQREEMKPDPSDTDHSEDDSPEQTPKNRGSYAKIPPHSKPKDRPFSCSECGKKFRAKSGLNQHAVCHTQERRHKCSVCEEDFPNKTLLSKHMKAHAAVKRILCSLCQKGFVKDSRLAEHQRIVHHICPVCSQRFAEKKSLNEHLKLHVAEGTLDSSAVRVSKTIRPFSCSQCGAKFRFRSVLQRHESSVHREKALECSVCQESFTQKCNVKEHMKTHAEEKPFSCCVCRKGFTFKGRLNKHMRVHTGEKPCVCSVCEKGFVKKSDLSRHQKSVHRMCPICPELFSDKVTLTEHLQGHVEEGTLGSSSFLLRENIRSFSCSECDKSCVLKADLCRHQRLVHHICPLCSERLSDRVSLNEHLKGHVEEGALDASSALFRDTIRCFSCAECGKSFRRRTTLKEHMSVHTGRKPYRCSVCERSFSQKSNLRSHMKTHTGEKPFVCSVCERGFTQSGSLKTHMNIHTREKPFVCSVCEERFVSESDLSCHSRLIHHICPVCSERFTETKSLNEHLNSHEEEGTLDPSSD